VLEIQKSSIWSFQYQRFLNGFVLCNINFFCNDSLAIFYLRAILQDFCRICILRRKWFINFFTVLFLLCLCLRFFYVHCWHIFALRASLCNFVQSIKQIIQMMLKHKTFVDLKNLIGFFLSFIFLIISL